MLIRWDEILTFMIPARRLLMTKRARDITFTSQPKDSEARCFGLMPGCCIYLRLSQNPSQGMSTVAAVAYGTRHHLELCGELVGKILKSPTNALVCLKLFQPAFVSLFASVPSKDLE